MSRVAGDASAAGLVSPVRPPGGTETSAAPPTARDAADDDRGAAWVLLPAAWCLWLLVWLVPSLLVAGRLETPLPWLTARTAPAALVAGAAFFLVGIWPFWPALAAPRGRPGRPDGRWFGRTLLELAILAALAAPHALVAWSVGGRPWHAGPVAAAWAVAAVLGLAIRLADARIGRDAGRRLMFLATIACAGPLAVAYGVAETLGTDLARLVEMSPMAACMRLALDGWPDAAWAIFTGLVLWPAAAVVLAVAALLQRGWHAAAGGE